MPILWCIYTGKLEPISVARDPIVPKPQKTAFNVDSPQILLLLMSGWCASIRGDVAMSHSSTSSPIRCSGTMFAHSLAAMIFRQIPGQQCGSAGGAATLVMSPSEQKLSHEREELSRICINKRIIHSSEIKWLEGRRQLVPFLIGSHRHGCRQQRSEASFVWECRGSTKWLRLRGCE